MGKKDQKPDISEKDSYKSLLSRWKTLATEAQLATPRASITSLERKINQLADQIAAVRKRGYVFNKTLEQDAKQLRARWVLEERAARKILDDAGEPLKKTVRSLEKQLSLAEKRRKLHDDVGRKLDLFKAEIDDVTSRVNASLRNMHEGVNDIEHIVNEATKLYDALAEASFKLYPDEHAVAMRPADNIGRRDAEGILFLTDKRVIYESREKRATKKRFFITVESELVTELLWHAPVGSIVDATGEDKGGFIGIGDKDLLALTFADDVKDAPEKVTVRFRKYSDNEEWAKTLIPYVKSGKIAGERLDVVESAEFDTANLPTTCPNCLAALPKIYRGMHQVECEFCETVVNIDAA
jgi:hypothetical protein